MPRGSLTSFLTALSEEPGLREAYEDPARRDEVLRDWGLDGHEALQPGATLADMRAAVANESEGGEAGVEWWILADGGPVRNDSFGPGGHES